MKFVKTPNDAYLAVKKVSIVPKNNLLLLTSTEGRMVEALSVGLDVSSALP